MLGGTTVTCPLHERVYDLASGRELTGDCDLATFPVRRTTEGTIMLLPANTFESTREHRASA